MENNVVTIQQNQISKKKKTISPQMKKAHAKRKRARQKFWKNYFGPMLCYYCYSTVSRSLPDAHPKKATVEHLVPLASGGNNGKNNLVLCCWECNNLKGKELDQQIRSNYFSNQQLKVA